jgi:hypothetical protein
VVGFGPESEGPVFTQSLTMMCLASDMEVNRKNEVIRKDVQEGDNKGRDDRHMNSH